MSAMDQIRLAVNGKGFSGISRGGKEFVHVVDMFTTFAKTDRVLKLMKRTAKTTIFGGEVMAPPAESTEARFWYRFLSPAC